MFGKGTPRLGTDDFLYFVSRALRGMTAVLAELGDELAVTRPELPSANTPYGLVVHCLAVVEYWAGHVVSGRSSHRVRDQEFDVVGSVAELTKRIEATLSQIAADLADLDGSAPVRNLPDPAFQGPDRALDQGGALLHMYEELAQHHGQLQVSRDALLPAPPARQDQHPYDPSMRWLRSKQGMKWQRPGPTQLPTWVADMDFPVAPVIRSAILDAVDRGDLGYPDWPGEHPLAVPFSNRMQQRFGWDADPRMFAG